MAKVFHYTGSSKALEPAYIARIVSEACPKKDRKAWYARTLQELEWIVPGREWRHVRTSEGSVDIMCSDWPTWMLD